MGKPAGNTVAKGKQNSFRNDPYVVAWVDLLGYGSMLEACGYDPTSFQAHAAVDRLERFTQLSLKHTGSKFPILQMNDGMVAWRKLSLRTKSVTQDFLARSLSFFYALTEVEREHGYPGQRMVIATGIRMKMDSLHKTVAKERADQLLAKVKSGQKTFEQAINEACNYVDYCNGVDALQANFAFTKAYLAEQGGSAEGLRGNNIYIDLKLFHSNTIDCLTLSKPFIWRDGTGLRTTFAKVEEFSRDTFMEYSELDLASTENIAMQLMNCMDRKDLLKRLKE